MTHIIPSEDGAANGMVARAFSDCHQKRTNRMYPSAFISILTTLRLLESLLRLVLRVWLTLRLIGLKTLRVAKILASLHALLSSQSLLMSCLGQMALVYTRV